MDSSDHNQGDAYLIQDSLLASGDSELLPTNTKIFSSTVRFGRPFFFAGVVSVVFFLVLLIVGAALPRPAGFIVIGLAFGAL
jgi:hypothetical protein